VPLQLALNRLALGFVMRPPLRRKPPGSSGGGIKSELIPAGRPLPLPHEMDQSLNSTAEQPDPVMQQAARDIEAGLVDTDLHGTPGMDHVERERLLKKERVESEKAMAHQKDTGSKHRNI